MSKIIPLYESGDKTQSPLGFPMCQNRIAPMVWSYAMEILNPAQIVEIGSLNGGFATALAFISYLSRCKIYSFDICNAPNEDWSGLAMNLGVTFFKEDVFSSNHVSELVGLRGTSFLLCDGGNKPKEFETFAPSLKDGDIIAAHDYCCDTKSKAPFWPWSETTIESVSKTVKEHNLQPFMQEYFDMAGWLVYRKT